MLITPGINTIIIQTCQTLGKIERHTNKRVNPGAVLGPTLSNVRGQTVVDPRGTVSTTLSPILEYPYEPFTPSN